MNESKISLIESPSLIAKHGRQLVLHEALWWTKADTNYIIINRILQKINFKRVDLCVCVCVGGLNNYQYVQLTCLHEEMCER